jgi:hypothetical protein
MLRRVGLVATDVHQGDRIGELGKTLAVTSNRRRLRRNTSFIRVTRIGELETTLAVTSNRRTLRRNTTDSCHPVEGGAKFLQNIGSYKSHTA